MQRSAKPAELKASPFIPFRYQQTLIKTLVDRINKNQPLVVQKSSSIGATSAVLLVYLGYFLFRADSNFLIMTPNIFDLYMPKLSNYAKIPVFNFLMFVIKQLPEGLRPEVRFVRNRKKHFYCYLENTGNGNRIVGLSVGTKRDIAEILNSPPAILSPVINASDIS